MAPGEKTSSEPPESGIEVQPARVKAVYHVRGTLGGFSLGVGFWVWVLARRGWLALEKKKKAKAEPSGKGGKGRSYSANEASFDFPWGSREYPLGSVALGAAGWWWWWSRASAAQNEKRGEDSPPAPPLKEKEERTARKRSPKFNGESRF